MGKADWMRPGSSLGQPYREVYRANKTEANADNTAKRRHTSRNNDVNTNEAPIGRAITLLASVATTL